MDEDERRTKVTASQLEDGRVRIKLTAPTGASGEAVGSDWETAKAAAVEALEADRKRRAES